MTEQTEHDLECRIHSLLCGALAEHEKCDLLSLIARDEHARQVLAECIEDQRQSRAAFGYDRAGGVMQHSLEQLKATLVAGDRSGRRSIVVRLVSPRWLIRIAAGVVIVVSMYAATTASRNSRLVSVELARVAKELKISQAMPAITLTAANRERYQRIWKLVTGDGQTWMIFGNGGIEFGSFPREIPGTAGDRLLLIQCRIVDDLGEEVYSKDLLMPDLPEMDREIAHAGHLAGRPVTLVISRTARRARVRVSLADQEGFFAGVVGQIVIGPDEIGQIGEFRVDDRMMRVFVRAHRLPGTRI